jgi:transitional endoplasmic reticulum ATPase
MKNGAPKLPAASRVVLVQNAQVDAPVSGRETGRWAQWLRSFGNKANQSDALPSFDQKDCLGLTVRQGDKVDIAGAAYRVTAMAPVKHAVIDAQTEIVLRPHTGAVSYADIGGLGKEVARVREMVELPLRHPQLFTQLGIDPPKGVLLYGPPGCGKTLIARAVAHEAGVHFINVNGPEIIQQHYGESEAVLREIFTEAQNHPASIIFFDEIDAIAPSRETVLGDVEKRVVAQLLALLDGLNARGQVVVIAATNLPDNVDPALRRPGRFDREIAISPPDKAGRLEVLQIHTQAMPLAIDVDLEKIAAQAHGFIGADLAALCREAAMCCARELHHPDMAENPIPPARLERIRVTMAHFEQALTEIEPTSTRQVATDVAATHWSDIGGLEEVKLLLQETVEWPLKYASRFEYCATAAAKGVLLTGVSGSGKTLMAKAIATESGVNFITVRGPELLSKWVGESERAIREVFKKARQSAPCIVFFDEIDAIAPARGHGAGSSNIGERMVGQLLLDMDRLEDCTGVMVLAATNRPDLLDQALCRPGRFEHIVELPLPDESVREQILAIHCRKRKLDTDINLAELARQTAGMSGTELRSLCDQAARQAIRASITASQSAEFAPFAINQAHFAAALRTARKRTTDDKHGKV